MSTAAPSPRRPGNALSRAIRQRRWWILSQWLILASVFVGLLLYLGEGAWTPRYEATAWLRVDSTRDTPLDQKSGEGQHEKIMQTQAQLVSSPDVLGTVAMDPRILSLPMMEEEPESAIRRALRVTVPDGTNLMLVSLSSNDAKEAATIVGTVIRAYMEASKTWTNDETRKQIVQLTEYKKAYYEQITRLREKMHAWSQKGAMADATASPDEMLKTYHAYRQKLDALDLEIIDAQATLSTLAELGTRSNPSGGIPTADEEDVAEKRLKLEEEARFRLAKLKREQEEVRKSLAELRLQQQTDAGTAVQAAFDAEDLSLSVEMHRKISAALEDAEYRAHGPSRVTLVSKPKATLQPTINRRFGWFLGAAILGPLLGLVLYYTIAETIIGPGRSRDEPELVIEA